MEARKKSVRRARPAATGDAPVVRAIPDLWPAGIETNQGLSPRCILQEQADLLTQRTGCRLVGEVATRVLGRDFSHTLFVTAPALDNYRHFVLRIRHFVDTLYPVRVSVTERDEAGEECGNSEDFCVRLRAVLAEERTIEIVRALLAQCP